MKWMDVILGEVAAKRDAAAARASRRREVMEAAEARFDSAVRPTVQAFQARMREAGVDLALAEEVQDADRDTRVLRLSHAVHDHPLCSYVEFAAEPYNHFIVVWMRAPRESRPRRHEIFRIDELDADKVEQCLEAFAMELFCGRKNSPQVHANKSKF